MKFNEILTEITIPVQPEYSGLSYMKLRLRDTMDFPLLGVAASVWLEGKDEKCRELRLVLSAVSPSPIVLEKAAEITRGRRITPKLVEEVSQEALKTAHPVANIASSPRYRREIGVLTTRAIHKALEGIKNPRINIGFGTTIEERGQ